MKKKILFILITLLCITLTGCFDRDNLEDSKITTTVYPIEYLVTELYDTDNEITSIYPNGTDIEDFSLTDKQITDYSKTTNLFVYNGLTDEKDIAKQLVNLNKNMQIIDVSYGLNYTYGVEELWLNPNNYLMLANTIKDDLEEISASKYVSEKIEANYSELEENLTSLDADLRTIGKNAKEKGTNTIIIAYDSLGFLEKYNFNVINITNENNITTAIKNKFKDKTYKYILVDNKDNISDSVKDIVDNYGAELIEVDVMNTLTDKQRENKENYLTIMNEFLISLSNITLK